MNNDNKQTINFNLLYIYNNIYIPTISKEEVQRDIKTSGGGETPKKFIKVLKKMGEVTRRYKKGIGNYYNIIPNEDTIEMSKWEVKVLIDYLPLNEEGLVTLYINLLDKGIDPNVIEDMLELVNEK